MFSIEDNIDTKYNIEIVHDFDNVYKMLILHFADLGQFFLHLLIDIGFTFQAFYLSFTQDGTAAAWIRLPRCQGAER